MVVLCCERNGSAQGSAGVAVEVVVCQGVELISVGVGSPIVKPRSPSYNKALSCREKGCALAAMRPCGLWVAAHRLQIQAMFGTYDPAEYQ